MAGSANVSVCKTNSFLWLEIHSAFSNLKSKSKFMCMKHADQYAKSFGVIKFLALKYVVTYSFCVW